MNLCYNRNMKFVIITLFPEMLEPMLNTSMLWKAKEKGLVDYELVNLREFGIGPRHQVDDTPYGGGDGMLMKPEPIFAAIESVRAKYPNCVTFLPTPHGRIWDQEWAKTLSSSALSKNGESVSDEPRDDVSEERPKNSTSSPTYCVLCPHYEGYDARVLELFDHQFRIGNYILTGGELPAMIFIDSITRLIPGVLGGEQSAEVESFSEGDNLEFPQYTRPEDFRGLKVPEVLLSGHHGEIAKWRAENSSRISDTM